MSQPSNCARHLVCSRQIVYTFLQTSMSVLQSLTTVMRMQNVTILLEGIIVSAIVVS